MLPLIESPAIERSAEPSHSIQVTVAARSASPGVGTGYLMTTVLIVGVDDAGKAGAYFIPFGIQQRYPSVGTRCRFKYSDGQPDVVGGGFEFATMVRLPVVSEFECDATDSSLLPP